MNPTSAGSTVNSPALDWGVIVRVTVALLVESARLVAVTLTWMVEATMGAVNKPDELTLPCVADHVTALLPVLLTNAVNCAVIPETTVAFEGEVETLTLPRPPTEKSLPPHANSNSRADNARSVHTLLPKCKTEPAG